MSRGRRAQAARPALSSAYESAQVALPRAERGEREQVGQVLALGHQLDCFVLVGLGEVLGSGEVVAGDGGLDLAGVVGVELVELVDQTHDPSSGSVLSFQCGEEIGSIQYSGGVICVPPSQLGHIPCRSSATGVHDPTMDIYPLGVYVRVISTLPRSMTEAVS